VAEVAEAPKVPVPEGAESDEPEVAEPPMTLVQPPNAPDVTERTVRKAPLDEAEGGQAAFGLYPALLGVGSDVRPKYLTEELHRVRTAPEGGGESITLQQYLATPSSTDRRKVIAAYWLAAERAAKYQVLTTQVSFFEELEPVAMQQRDEALGAEAMLELRAAKAAAQADLLASRLNLLEAQFQLTRRAGRPLESSWLLPATIPHASHVKLKLDAQPKELAESWPVRRLAAAIPAFSKGLQERADAVARADDSRASAIEAYRAGRQPIAPVLASIARQTEETFTFLETLTQYNEAIADYALRVLPSTIRGEQLASALVVIR
ncbi:MAG: hypothetical protein HQ582_28045, partial [Planctomycetes bacterium]|nr:hypothetical protein [Planctomycetota bacterium]